MAVLPKSNSVPITARKKAVPPTKAAPVPPAPPKPVPVVEPELPKVEKTIPKPVIPKKAPPTKLPVQKIKKEVPQMEATYIIDSTEPFGCCNEHKSCIEAGDCVMKKIRLHYATTCALYKTYGFGGE